MHRFWIFPLLVGSVAALYPGICSIQAWQSVSFCRGITLPWFVQQEITRTLMGAAPWGFVVGLAIGAVSAWSGIVRIGSGDRSGFSAAKRLLGNGFWLAFYALLIDGVTLTVVRTVLKLGLMSSTDFDFWFPGLFFLSFGSVNLSAILWAVTRTSTTEDVLTPPLLLSKIKRSSHLTG